MINDISPEQIQEHREIEKLSLDEIKFYSSFTQILGKRPEDYSPDERKARWRRNMDLLIGIGSVESVEHWMDSSECSNCIYLNAEESWCERNGLPCTYNPILTPSSGYKGMACMGIGRECQTKLF